MTRPARSRRFRRRPEERERPLAAAEIGGAEHAVERDDADGAEARGRKRPQQARRGDQHLGSRVGARDRELREPAAHRGLDPLRVPAERAEPMTAASRAPLGQGLGAGAERAAEEPLLAGIGERDAAVGAPEDVAALDAEQRRGAPGHDEGDLAAARVPCPRWRA